MRKFLRSVGIVSVLAVGVFIGQTPVFGDAFRDGFTLQRAEDYGKARRAYLKATRADDALPEAWYHLGLVQEQLGEPAAAVKAYRAAIKVDPQSPFLTRYRTNLAWALIDSGAIADGLQELQRIVDITPDEPWPVANVAHALYVDAQDYNRAESWYQQLVNSYGPASEEHERASRWLRESKQRATLFKIGTGYENYRGEIIAGTYRGVNYGPIDDAKAIDIVTKQGARKRISKDEIRFFDTEPKYKGMGVTIRGGRTDRVRRRFEMIFAPENMREGNRATSAKQYDVAERQFVAALAKNPKSTAARMSLAQTLYQQKAYRRAAKEFEAVLALDASNAQAHRYLVSLNANYLKDLGAALQHALAYLALPDVPEREGITTASMRITRNLIEDNRKRPERVWTREVGLDFDSASHRRVLGQAYLEAGEYGPALRHLGAAVQMNSSGDSDGQAFEVLQDAVSTLESANPASPDIAYYRAYIAFTEGRLSEALSILRSGAADPRARTLEALVRAYRSENTEAATVIAQVDRAALPPHTQRIFDTAEAVLSANEFLDSEAKTLQSDEFHYSRVGAVNGLGVYSDSGTGDLMPIICVARDEGRGRVEVNGNPQFDFFSVLSFKEAFDWVENEVNITFPREWNTTITFGGLSLYLGKGGDSAGCAIALALRSAVLDQPALQNVAITGAIRLDGRVEPVGAISEKVLGAVEHNIRTVVLPEANLNDLGSPSGQLCSRVKFVAVSSIDQAVMHAFGEHNPETAERYTESERQFRLGARYYQLGAYALAREQLTAVVDTTPENYSAARLLELIGTSDSGPVIATLTNE